MDRCTSLVKPFLVSTSLQSRVMIFGGIYDRHILMDDVVAYSESGWSKIGKLKTINFQMTPINVGGDIYVFGGGGDFTTPAMHTEIWRVSFNKIFCGISYALYSYINS